MKMPTSISPMLATLVEEPFNNDEWLFELKWDGYRIISFLNNKKVKLQSRNLKDYSVRFNPITNFLSQLDIKAVIDGEVVFLNKKGVSIFNDLQNWKSEKDGPLYYYAFDLLWYNGKSLVQMPLIERRTILRELLPDSNNILFSEDIDGKEGMAFFKLIRKKGLEGIIAKKLNSIYKPGERTRDWVKIKAVKREEFLICGYTRNEGGKLFSSLIIGQYTSNVLQYSGQVGTGFKDKDLREILQCLKPLETKRCPFKIVPDLMKGGRWSKKKPSLIVWCKPALVCEVKFLERTKAGELRHQSFFSLRDDKNPSQVLVS